MKITTTHLAIAVAVFFMIGHKKIMSFFNGSGESSHNIPPSNTGGK